MIQKTVCISHLLPINRETAAKIAMCTNRYDCTFIMEHNNSMLNLKSMLGLLSQVIPKDGVVRLTSDGVDEEAAMTDILNLLKKSAD